MNHLRYLESKPYSVEQDLAEFLLRNPPPPAQIRRLSKSLARALAYLDTLNINTVVPPGGGTYPWPGITVLGPDAGGMGLYNDLGNVLLETNPSGTAAVGRTPRTPSTPLLEVSGR